MNDAELEICGELTKVVGKKLSDLVQSELLSKTPDIPFAHKAAAVETAVLLALSNLMCTKFTVERRFNPGADQEAFERKYAEQLLKQFRLTMESVSKDPNYHRLLDKVLKR